MMKRKVAVKPGFTLVELVLAIGFVSLLLLAVSILTIRVSDMYEKGATVRSINQVSREVVDVMRRDFAQSSKGITLKKTGPANRPTYRLCLGDVSYIANSAALLTAREEEGSAVSVITKIGDTSSSGVLRMVRVSDKGGTLCQSAGGGGFPAKVDASATELLTSSSIKLALHDMSLQQVASSPGQQLFRLNMLVGTNEVGTVDEDTRCRANSDRPEDSRADFNYCSIAELTTVMRTGGEV